MRSKNINCPNCGAILGNGRYCQYCGTDTCRTEHINLYVDTHNVPTKNFVISIELSEYELELMNKTMSAIEKENKIKQLIIC